MKTVLIIGAGKIGSILAELLAGSGDYRVRLADRSEAQFEGMAENPAIEPRVLDVGDQQALAQAMGGCFAVISAAPFHLTTAIAQAAAQTGAHYLDLTEDVASTRVVRKLAATARSAFLPQCGLAPGFITIVAHDMAKRFDQIDSIRMRVGALPQFPSNALNYNLTWSTDGVINEYCEPCEAIVNGERRETQPLEGLEQFSLDGVAYEAFNTSGGLGSMCETYAGRVRSLDYRSIRYPGHAAIMRALLHDLRLRERRDVLKDILERAVPATAQDVVVIFVTVSGVKGERLVQETYANKIYARKIGGRVVSAIQATTTAGAATALDLLAQGALAQRGLVRQEDIALDAFLANRFGQVYAREAERLAA